MHYYCIIILTLAFLCCSKTDKKINSKGQTANNEVKVDSLCIKVSLHLKEIDDNIDNLSDDQILSFFDAFEEDFEDNAEVGEWRNELLYTLTQKYPDKIIRALEKSRVNKNYVYFDFENPIHDGIDVSITYQQIKKVKSTSPEKDSVLFYLSKAIKKIEH